MPEVKCPATTCTYNLAEKCLADKLVLRFRAAIDFPGKGTIVYYECDQQELPKDRENAS
jgi:hypothetical protein